MVAGAVFFPLLAAYEYWRGLRWLFGWWDPNMGHATEDELISKVNRTALLFAALLLVWSFVGPSPYRRNWEIEVIGIGTGMLIAYVLIICTAAGRARNR